MAAVAALGRAAWAGIDPEGFFRRHASDRRPFPVRFPGLGEVLFFSTAEGARDILTVSGAESRAPLPNPIEPVVGRNSLILLSGEAHRRARSALAPPFRGEIMRRYVEVIAEATSDHIATLRPGDQLLVGETARGITLDVVIRVVFGVTDGARRREYARVTAELLRSGNAALMLVPVLRRDLAGRGPWARLLAFRSQLDQMLSEQIEERKSSGEPGSDVLDLILGTTDDEGNLLPDDVLHDQLRTMLAAGHETSATSLTWALYHIHRDEGIRSRVVEELATVATPAGIASLPYLGAVIQETLRVHPTVPIVLRRLTVPLTIAGVARSAGDVVGIALPALHFNPELWADPESFDPQRFLNAKPSPFHYAPFGGGYRRCIGAAFAHSELAVAIGTIMKSLELRARGPGGTPPRAVPRGIATRPRREIALDVLARR
ncbi:cytochrome P450 [Mycobacterium sp. CVI_P3]|uniref:Cytochrome P450 n=1 Tax=Mycobacterium pinniadriaticum TaxID=2994102 RepID=A0ABT3SHC4_9MYCO|nr:cytochrome P450 [Mycobacterium pinniadriaticum]MCX2932120.1 cytochrome P450 [Mycobacterium pinniadriaticum]MCX2938544.1 cytochrome P450 [Mycobacterium pinniadriaticum]